MPQIPVILAKLTSNEHEGQKVWYTDATGATG